ncbi:MAG: hypothetical protein V4857_28300 [Pseudomonadota bacterium]
MSFGKIIFGDNQFLGINHASQQKAAVMQDQFRNIDEIVKVLGYAYEAGVRDFMFTTHDHFGGAFEEIARARMFPDMQYIPCIPYAHKYANALAENGIFTVVMSRLRAMSKRRVLSGVGKAALGDLGGMMQLLVEVELLMTKGLNVRGVFLQNVIFDLMMGMGGQGIIEKFHKYVGRIGLTPGYITMNHPMAQRMLCDEIGLEKPWICSNFNVAGFRMNPSQETVEQSYGNGKSRNIAMSIFASGMLSPQESVDYALARGGVDAVLFGSSKQANIVSNVERLLGRAGAAPARPAPQRESESVAQS